MAAVFDPWEKAFGYERWEALSWLLERGYRARRESFRWRPRRVRIPSRNPRSGESLAVERQQAAPCLLRLRLVVDLRIGRAPTVRGPRVDFDFGGQLRLGEGVLQNGFVVGRPHVVVFGDLDEKLRLALRRLQMRAVRHVGHQSASVERGDRANAIRYGSRSAERNWTAHAITLSPDLPILGDRGLLIEPCDERLRVGHVRRFAQTLCERHQLLNGCFGAGFRSRRFLDAVERIDHEDRVARFGKPLPHLTERGTQPEDIGPDEHAGGGAARRVHE